MTTRVIINTRTSGKFKREIINNRSHIVTTVMPIRGDITMNGIFYPDIEVANSFEQMNLVPAPNNHPNVNGVNISALHPLAINAHNIGAFIRNVRKKGKRVFADYVIDETVANQTDDGKEVIRRIEASEKIGVSTGLNIEMVTNASGKDDFGKPFTRKATGFNFDHVATLLNQVAAGEHAGTELVLNEGKDDEVMVVNLAVNELSTSDISEALHELIRDPGRDRFVFINDIFPDSKTFIFTVESDGKSTSFRQSYAIDQNDEVTLLDDRQEGTKEFTPLTQANNEVTPMDKLQLVLAIIANAATSYTMADKAMLESLGELELINSVCKAASEDDAKAVLVNAGFDFDAYDAFIVNKPAFDEFVVGRESALKEKRDAIISNSEYTEEMLVGKSVDELDVITGLLAVKKPTARIGNGQQMPNTLNAAAENTVDFSQ